MTSPASDWWPAAGLDQLRLRARVLRRIRAFFDGRGVMEVETPLLVSAPLPESGIEPMVCGSRYLHASPEAAMKRLLAAGSGPIYQMGRVFRAGEIGSRHNPEFTMLEWYRPGWGLAEIIAETGALVDDLLGCGLPEVLTVAEAFREYAGVDLWQGDDAALAEAARPCHPPAGLDRAGLFDFLLVTRVEEGLARRGGAVVLREYPPFHAAMAAMAPGDPPRALRFELYVHGVELANGYQELTDATEQRRRLEAANRQRRREGLPELPLDERFLQALSAGLPPCAGVALGVDRLAMLAAGADSLAAVMAFPDDRI